MSNFHKPVKRPGDVIELLQGSGDPAELGTLAHDTARALLHRVGESEDGEGVADVIAFADGGGIDELAELWSASGPETLPGILWRLHLLRHVVRESPSAAAYRFRRGTEVDTVGQAIAGSPGTPGPDEVVEIATQILRGAFSGDSAAALERASAFARVMAAGSQQLVASGGDEARVAEERTRLDGYRRLSAELAAGARLWRSGELQ